MHNVHVCCASPCVGLAPFPLLKGSVTDLCVCFPCSLPADTTSYSSSPHQGQSRHQAARVHKVLFVLLFERACFFHWMGLQGGVFSFLCVCVLCGCMTVRNAKRHTGVVNICT